MQTFRLLVAILLLTCASTFAGPLDDVYQLGPDSQPHDGVPRGKLTGPFALSSKVFPNSTRNYWVYVPAQYDAKTPASVMVFQDGHAFIGPGGDFRVPTVFDNLIYRREMPVTIGIFINPGHDIDGKEASDKNWGDNNSNRKLEYNALDDKYAKLVIDELLPAVAKDYSLSTNPDERAIAGSSSGAIAAFTVAWQRPDQFRKVISFIGSYTNIMGGHVYPNLIKESDPKPIRIFLQDGLNDLRGIGRPPTTTPYDAKRDWHAQNIKMVEALTAKKYDVNYTWGIGSHSGKHGAAILPEMLRWLWRDYPRPKDDPHDDSNRGFLVPTTQP